MLSSQEFIDMYLERQGDEPTLQHKEDKKSFKFKLYDPQDPGKSYKPTPLKFYSTSVDFSPTLENPLAHLYPTTALSTFSRTASRITVSQEYNNLEQVIGRFDKGPFADDIIAFLDPFFKSMHEKDLEINTDNGSVLAAVILHLKIYCEQNKENKEKLLKTMNVKQLVVPYISLNLPGELILTYNELEEDDPQVLLYQHHPLIASEVRELGVFLDRYDTNKEVLCLLVWSNVDNILVNLPSVGLNPYPLCWNCSKRFGMNTCGRCGVAKYCTRECQVQQWKYHKITCAEMAYFSSKHKHLYIT